MDEREIEAVCRAWWPTWPKAPNPEGERHRARDAIEALDRVRDARGDDEPGLTDTFLPPRPVTAQWRSTHR